MKKRVIIIAGHNGKGTGACGYLDEGAETMLLRDELCDWIRIKYPSLEIISDRGRDNLKLNALLLWLRGIFFRDDICIDLHFNASAHQMVSGCEVFIPDNPSEREKALGKAIVEFIAQTLRIPNRGVKKESQSQHKRLAMLSGFDCTNILIEVCFCTNEYDVKNYKTFKPELIAGLGKIIGSMRTL